METYMQQPKLSSICLAVITSALLLTSTAGFATNYKGEGNYKGEVAPAPCPQPLYLKDGFYVGVNALYDNYRTRVTRSFVLGTSSGSSTNVVASNGWGGGAFAGYGMYFNNLYYLAGEIFVDGSSASQAISSTSTAIGAGGVTNNANFKASASASWGVSVLPGLKLNDSSLGYIRLGYEGARLRGQQFGSTTSAGGLSSYGSSSKWLSGFNYGVGLETAVYQNVSVRGEFNHTGYGSTSAGGASFSPTDNQYTLGLIYHFA
jgi:opacity protein-like surface antigen